MNKDIIPSKDADFDIFQDKLIADSTTNAVAWGIPTGIIAALTSSQTDWTSAWAVAKNKGNRTQADVTAKKTARVNLTKQLRPFIRQYIRVNPLITNTERKEMGIKPLDFIKTPAAKPTTVPQIDLKSKGGLQMRFHFKQGVDEAGVSRRGKPKQIHRCAMVYKVGDPEPASYAECTLRVESGRSPLTVTFAPADAGKKVYVFGTWVNTRNQEGPWTTDPATGNIV